MVNILFGIETLGGGGAEKVLLNILTKLDRNKFKITLQLLSNEGVYFKELPDDIDVKFIFGSKERFSGIRRVLYILGRFIVLQFLTRFPFFVRFFIKDKNTYDLGISFCEGFNQAFFLYRKNKFQFLCSWIHIDFRKHIANVSKRYLKGSLVKFDRLVCVSDGAKSGLLETFDNLDPSKVFVIYNPIDYDAIIKESEDKSSIPKWQCPTIVSIGRLSKQKRFDRVLRVAQRLKKEGLNAKFFILGEGPEEDNLLGLHKALGLEDYVVFLGFKRNVAAWIASADIVLMTSDYEGLPVVICEAMVLDKPIVSTSITGPTELLENGKYGLLVQTDDSDIYSGLKRMLLNKEFRDHFNFNLKSNKDKFIFKNSISDIEVFINSFFYE